MTMRAPRARPDHREGRPGRPSEASQRSPPDRHCRAAGLHRTPEHPDRLTHLGSRAWKLISTSVRRIRLASVNPCPEGLWNLKNKPANGGEAVLSRLVRAQE